MLPLMINNIILKKSLPVYGQGENIRDWLYVEDHAKAIDMIFHKGASGEIFNIGGNNEWRNIDLVKLLCRIVDKKIGNEEGDSLKLITYVKDRPGHDLRYAIDASKVISETGWRPEVTFEVGLEKTVDWYLDNQQWLANVTSGEYLKYYENMYQNR
jgi:dTDP-glucose 4,6-dehydratase